MPHWPVLITPLVWLSFIAGPVLAVLTNDAWWLLLCVPIILFW